MNKVQYSINLIQKAEPLALNMHPDGFHLAFSGGKDSQVLYELAKMSGVKFQSYFYKTSVDHPELLKFIKENYPDVIWIKPQKTMFQLILEKKYLPMRQFNHFDIWNNNMEYIEQNEAFNTPAVFIEFNPITWKHQGNGVREASVDIVLHVITQRNAPTSHELPYEEQAFAFFDLLTEINVCLHGHVKTGENFGHDALTSTQSTTDHDFEELRHDMEVFTCHATDCSAIPKYKKVKAKPVIQVE